MSKPAIDFSKPNKPIETTPTEAPRVANINAPTAPAATMVVQEPMTLISARIPEQLHHSMKLFCVANRTDMKDFIAAAIREKPEAHGQSVSGS